MKTDYYDWDEIFQRAADVLTRSLAHDPVPISKATELHAKLTKLYSAENRRFPKSVTFRKQLHKKLNINPDQRIYKTTLYQLIGLYQKMTIPALAGYLTTSGEPTDCNSCYLFFRVKRDKQTTTDNRKILYATAKAMKEKFKNKILFLSYDDDTLVILCADSDSKKSIKSYIQNCMKSAQEAAYDG